MENKFANYKKYLSNEVLNQISPVKKSKYVAVMKLKYPSKDANIEKSKEDLIDLIKIHNTANREGYFELLDLKGNLVVLGVELPDTYGINTKGKKQVSRYIGNNISRKLYRDYQWNRFTTRKNALFTIIEIKEIKE